MVIALGGISSGRILCGAGGWWGDIVGKGAAIDLERYCALGFDFAPGGDQRVRISPDDQARLIEIALGQLGIDRVHALVGASYGGMVGLALAQRAPHLLQRLCVISATHEPAPLASAWRGVQRRIVEFAIAEDKPAEGLSLARQLAMITYRSSAEFEQRFARNLDEGGRSDLDAYLVARGEAYIDVMAPRRWLSLSEIDRPLPRHPGGRTSPHHAGRLHQRSNSAAGRHGNLGAAPAPVHGVTHAELDLRS